MALRAARVQTPLRPETSRRMGWRSAHLHGPTMTSRRSSTPCMICARVVGRRVELCGVWRDLRCPQTRGARGRARVAGGEAAAVGAARPSALACATCARSPRPRVCKGSPRSGTLAAAVAGFSARCDIALTLRSPGQQIHAHAREAKGPRGAAWAPRTRGGRGGTRDGADRDAKIVRVGHWLGHATRRGVANKLDHCYNLVGRRRARSDLRGLLAGRPVGWWSLAQ